jgi:hypothetical protein
MKGLRKNTLNILLFILWLGMGVSLTTARADDVNSYNTDPGLSGSATARQHLVKLDD